VYRGDEAVTGNVINVCNWNRARLSGSTLCEMQTVNAKRTHEFM